MKTQTQKSSETINISREKLVSLVSQSFGGASGYPIPDEPHKPGPWDPYIHRALIELRAKLERQKLFPHEEAWRILLTLGAFNGREEAYDALIPHSFRANAAILSILLTDSLAELNPQPLPPRAMLLAAITQQVLDRVLLIQETADMIKQAGDEQGIIIVSGKIKAYITDIDELCPRIPKKFPKPKGGSRERFSGFELLAASAVFQENTLTVFNEELRNELRNAGAKLAEMGIARM